MARKSSWHRHGSEYFLIFLKYLKLENFKILHFFQILKRTLIQGWYHYFLGKTESLLFHYLY